MKINRDKVKGFILGIVATIAFAGIGGTAWAASKGTLLNIRVVQGGINLFVDGKLSIPKDANGKTVEPFIYDGTTYLPLRAVSDLLTNSTKPVKWDSENSSVYIGQDPTTTQTDLSKLPINRENSDGSVQLGETARFYLLDQLISPFNMIFPNQRLTYIINSQYSSLTANLVIPYENLNDETKGEVWFYNVDKQGRKTLITSFKAEAGQKILPVTVDLRGVEILEINISEDALIDGNYYENNGHLYNIILNGMK